MASAVLQRRPLRHKLAIVLLAAQVTLACITWLAAWYALESIIGTGPVLTIVGFALAVVVRPLGSWTPLLFGLSAPVVCAVGAFTIAIFHLGPVEAQRPILIILATYLFILLPAAVVAAAQIRQWPVHARVHQEIAWRYSMKSLLVVMTAVAILMAVLTAAAKSIRDFPIVFATFGSLAIVVTGFLAWRFIVHRQRLHQPTSTLHTIREWLDTKVFAVFLLQQPDVRCSFCGRTHRDAGQFAEGRGGSLICAKCAEECARRIAETQAKSGGTDAIAGKDDLPPAT